MDNIAGELSLYLLDRLKEVDKSNRLIVGLCGIPASGKSSLAKLVIDKCNSGLSSLNQGIGRENRDTNNSTKAILIGLDGWHLTRSQLDLMPNPKLAHDRRGAHWTFDGEGYLSFVQSLRAPISPDQSQVITAPTFDHARKDPDFDAITILPSHRIVLIEGLYPFLSLPPWNSAGLLLDERWVIDIPFEEASKRLVKRHVLTGVAGDMKEARWRAEENDMPNGKFVFENMLQPTRRIPSLDDPTFSITVSEQGSE